MNLIESLYRMGEPRLGRALAKVAGKVADAIDTPLAKLDELQWTLKNAEWDADRMDREWESLIGHSTRWQYSLFDTLPGLERLRASMAEELSWQSLSTLHDRLVADQAIAEEELLSGSKPEPEESAISDALWLGSDGVAFVAYYDPETDEWEIGTDG